MLPTGFYLTICFMFILKIRIETERSEYISRSKTLTKLGKIVITIFMKSKQKKISFVHQWLINLQYCVQITNITLPVSAELKCQFWLVIGINDMIPTRQLMTHVTRIYFADSLTQKLSLLNTRLSRDKSVFLNRIHFSLVVSSW